jgi:hypothetical protein
MDKSLAKYGFHRDDVTDVFMIIVLIIVEVQWNAEKTGYEPQKNAKSGVMPLGMGAQNRTQRKHLSFRKHSNAGKRTVELHKRPKRIRKIRVGF